MHSPKNLCLTSKEKIWITVIHAHVSNFQTRSGGPFIPTSDPVAPNKCEWLLLTIWLKGFGHGQFQIPLMSAADDRNSGNTSPEQCSAVLILVSCKSPYLLQIFLVTTASSLQVLLKRSACSTCCVCCGVAASDTRTLIAPVPLAVRGRNTYHG